MNTEYDIRHQNWKIFLIYREENLQKRTECFSTASYKYTLRNKIKFSNFITE